MNFYLVRGLNDETLVVSRYDDKHNLYRPNEGDDVTHNTVKLATITEVIDLGDLFTLTVDCQLPYILIGTILGIGRS